MLSNDTPLSDTASFEGPSLEQRLQNKDHLMQNKTSKYPHPPPSENHADSLHPIYKRRNPDIHYILNNHGPEGHIPSSFARDHTGRQNDLSWTSEAETRLSGSLSDKGSSSVNGFNLSANLPGQPGAVLSKFQSLASSPPVLDSNPFTPVPSLTLSSSTFPAQKTHLVVQIRNSGSAPAKQSNDFSVKLVSSLLDATPSLCSPLNSELSPSAEPQISTPSGSSVSSLGFSSFVITGPAFDSRAPNISSYSTSEEEAPKRQKRSYVSSKLGCINCRKRFKKRCDEVLPECSRCVQNKIRCSYLDEDEETINRIKRAHAIIADHKVTIDKQGQYKGPSSPQFGKFKLNFKKKKGGSLGKNAIAKPAQVKATANTPRRATSATQNTLMPISFDILNHTSKADVHSVAKPQKQLDGTESAHAARPLPSGISLDQPQRFGINKIQLHLYEVGGPRFASHNHTAFDFSIKNIWAQFNKSDLWLNFMFIAARKSMSLTCALVNFSIGFLRSLLKPAETRSAAKTVFQRIVLNHKATVFKSLANGLRILDRYKCFDPEEFLKVCDTFDSNDIETIYQVAKRLMYTSIVIHNAALVHPNNAVETSCFYGGEFSLMCSLQQVFRRFEKEYENRSFAPQTKMPVQGTKAIFMPNYNIECMHEFREQVREFYENCIADCPSKDIFNETIENEYNALDGILNKVLTKTRYVRDQNKVNQYPMQLLHEIMYYWLSNAPPRMNMIRDCINIPLTHRIFYAYWIALCYALNNIFPECYYFFGCSFDTCINAFGFDYNFYGKEFDERFDELQNKYQLHRLSDNRGKYADKEFLRKHCYYACRVNAFFNMRLHIFSNNIVLLNPYPEEFFEQHMSNRFKTRKCNNLKETQLTSFKKKFKPEHFISIDFEMGRGGSNGIFDSKGNFIFAKLDYPRHGLAKVSKFIDIGFQNEKATCDLLLDITGNKHFNNNFAGNDASEFYPVVHPDFPESRKGELTALMEKQKLNDATDFSLPLTTNGLLVQDFNPRFHNHEDQRMNIFYKNGTSINFDGSLILENVSDLYSDYYVDRNEILNHLLFNQPNLNELRTGK